VTAPRAGDAARAVELVARSSYGRLVAYLASASGGDLAGAEDALGDALLAALRTWPEHGVPERPEAWLLTAARRRVVDAARRRDVATRAAPDVAMLLEEQATARTAVVPDKRLELLFACAHPAVPEGMRSPLMLQTVLGLDAARIAPAFLVPPTTLGPAAGARQGEGARGPGGLRPARAGAPRRAADRRPGGGLRLLRRRLGGPGRPGRRAPGADRRVLRAHVPADLR
jgi:DNA-directed RNA polymerase specialized sigma24 family protein